MNFATLFKVQIYLDGTVYYTVLLDFDILCFLSPPCSFPIAYSIKALFTFHIFPKINGFVATLEFFWDEKFSFDNFYFGEPIKVETKKNYQEYCDSDRQF